jgi:ABC-type glycerol-3-phosphate transport system substrate-binding protein
MTRTTAALLLSALALSACGADGPPVRPTKPDPAPGAITVTGEARLGVTASN